MITANKTQPNQSEADFSRFQAEMTRKGYALTRLYRGEQFQEIPKCGAGRYEIWLEGDGFDIRVGAGQDLGTAVERAKSEVARTLSSPNAFKPGRMSVGAKH